MKHEPFNPDTPGPADSELDARLTRALARLPDAPVPSNFTSRLMQAVDLEESRRVRRWNFGWNWPAILPRLAVTASVVLFAGLTLYHHELAARRNTLARNAALVTGSQPMPSMEALQNFDAIQRMGQPGADQELLALLK